MVPWDEKMPTGGWKLGQGSMDQESLQGTHLCSWVLYWAAWKSTWGLPGTLLKESQSWFLSSRGNFSKVLLEGPPNVGHHIYLFIFWNLSHCYP